MNTNICFKERVARTLVGVVLVSFAFFGPQNPGFLLGAIPLATGIIGWCPPYALLGINTRKVK